MRWLTHNWAVPRWLVLLAVLQLVISGVAEWIEILT
jgi:hypothetical protein